jgi:hypothetical protein
MAGLKQQARVMAAAMRDQDETDARAFDAWRAVDKLSLCPADCLRHNKQALIEIRERVNAMLEREA